MTKNAKSGATAPTMKRDVEQLVENSPDLTIVGVVQPARRCQLHHFCP